MTSLSPSEQFLDLACLAYDGEDHPDRRAAALALLAAEPGLGTDDPWVAAAVGDADTLGRIVADEPGAASRPGGPRSWVPLLWLTYSRVPQQDPVGCARLLLAAGADPDAGVEILGGPTPFTALTGCFGEGESGPGRQPRHPHEQELAAVLLDAGADPNDAQTLYNRMFGRDDSHLALLLESGLGRGDGGPWQERLGQALESPDEMVRRQVDWAHDHGLTDRVALLADHGFARGCPDSAPSPWRRVPPRALERLGTPDAVRAATQAGTDLDELVDGHTLLHQAAWIGDAPMVGALLEAGASPDVLDSAHGSTPLGWAEWGCADATAALLRPVTTTR